MKRILIGLIAFGVAVAALAFWWLRYGSENAKIALACERLVLDQVAAPSTARFIDGESQFVTGNNRYVYTQYSDEEATLSSQIEEAKILGENIKAKQAITTEFFNKQLKAGNTDNMHLALADMTAESSQAAEATMITLKAETALSALKKLHKAYDASGQMEIWLQLDAQNRVGAMLRNKAICSYTPSPSQADTLKTLKLEIIQPR